MFELASKDLFICYYEIKKILKMRKIGCKIELVPLELPIENLI